MGLIDEEAEKAGRHRTKKRTSSGRKAGTAGVGKRFGKLNKFRKSTDAFIEKEEIKNSGAKLKNKDGNSSTQSKANQKEIFEKVSSDVVKSKPARRKYQKKALNHNKNEEVESEKALIGGEDSSVKPVGNSIATQISTQESEPTLPPEAKVFAGDIKGTIKGTNRDQYKEQLRNNKGTIREQLGNRYKEQKGTIKGTIKGTDFLGVDSLEKTISDKLSSLTGQKYLVLNTLFMDCKNKGSKITSRISTERLSHLLKFSKETLAIVLKRLCKDGFISRLAGKRGRNGYMQFELNEETWDYLSKNQIFQKAVEVSSSNDFQMSDNTFDRTNLGTIKGTIKGTNLSSSSSLYNSKEILTNTKPQELPDEWKNIQTPEVLKSIHFGARQIKQLFNRDVLTAEEVQESLDSFAYDLSNGGVKAKSGELNLLMGILMKNETPYISTEYMAEAQKAREEYLNKQKEYEEAKRLFDEMKNEQKFEAWKSSLSDEVKKKILDEKNAGMISNPILHDALLKDYFLELEGA